MAKRLGFIILMVVITFMTAGCYYDAPAPRADLKPDFYPQKTDVNTSSYIDPLTGEEQVVYDLNGYWKVWLGYADAVAIVQVDDKFEGRTVVGGGCCSHEYEAERLIIRGRIDGNLIHCEKRTADNEWDTTVTAFTDKNAEEFYCLGFPVRRFQRLGLTESYYPLINKRQ